MNDFLIKVKLDDSFKVNLNIFQQKPRNIIKYENEQNTLLFWGDPILTEEAKKNIALISTSEKILNKVAGHYYFLLYNNQTKQLEIGNSLFGILPVFYKAVGNEFFIANKTELLIGKGTSSYNSRFILENILFNYPLFNTTYIKEVKSLPVNSSIVIHKDTFSLSSNFNIEALFTSKPLSKKASLNQIVDTFLNSSDKYIPESFYYTSLTGGFDGRTLVAKGLSKQANLAVYSFGSYDSSDVFVAKRLANALNLKMKFFQLEDLYVNKNSLECGLEFIENSGGTAGFPRAHYQYAAKELAKETDVIITGNFGSEVFRAAHNAGAVISPNLYHLFSSNSFDEAILKLESSPEWKWLNSSAFNEAKESLYEDLKTFPAFNKDFDGFTKNQKFYKVVFDEVFRKYFGAEIVNQFQVIKNRTPYLDIEFLKTIFASEFAGVYSDFFTHNPLKRFKGQVVYANVLKRTNPTLLKMMTDKGYRPSDILSFLGKIRITLSYIDKRIKEKGDLLYDPYSVKKSFEYNKEFWRNIKPDKQYFNIEAFETKEKQSNAYSIALSQAWWYNSIKSVI